MSDEIEKFDEVNLYDGSIGRDGQYIWKKLPKAMTKREAEDYAMEHGLCPPERFRMSEPTETLTHGV